jgi:hypothetical protein
MPRRQTLTSSRRDLRCMACASLTANSAEEKKFISREEAQKAQKKKSGFFAYFVLFCGQNSFCFRPETGYRRPISEQNRRGKRPGKRRHKVGSAYGCFLSDLTRFTADPCIAPGRLPRRESQLYMGCQRVASAVNGGQSYPSK